MAHIPPAPNDQFTSESWWWPSQWPAWVWFPLQLLTFALIGLKLFVDPRFELVFSILAPVLLVWASLDLTVNPRNRWLAGRSRVTRHVVHMVVAVVWLLLVVRLVWSLPWPSAAAN